LLLQRFHLLRLVPRLLLVAAGYYAAAWFGLEFASLGNAVTLIWAPAGIGLAVLLRWGPAMLFATVPAHFAANFAQGSSVDFSAAAAAAGALAAWSGARGLRRLRFDPSFASLRDVLAFAVVGAVASPALAAFVGATGLAASGVVAWSAWPGAFARWWIGDGMGVLLVAPPLLLAERGVWILSGSRRGAEAAALAAALLLVGIAVLGPWHLLSTAQYPLSFAVLPVMVWAAYRLEPFGAASASLLVAGVALWGMLGRAGAGGSRDEAIFLMWAFLAVASLTSLVLGVVVAAQKRTEQEFREAQTTLQAIEAATQAGTWVWCPEDPTQAGSRHQVRLHGSEGWRNPVPAESLLRTIHHEDRARIAREFATAWDARGRIETEYRIVRPDGDIRWMSARGACLPVDATRPEGPLQVVGVHVDITARKRMQESVRRSERLASLGTFAAGVAHELNNPLGTILLAADFARTSLQDPVGVARALDDIVDDTRRAARIVKSLLQFANAEETERTRLDLGDCVRRAADLTRGHRVARGVALEVRVGDQALDAVANATEIEQMLVNLIRNAAEACDRGGRIWLEAEAATEELLVTVSDDGRGMTAVEQARVFDPFFTTRVQEGGTGLGLSICHGIVDAHGGRIEIESALGTGTRVRVRLPRADLGARPVAEKPHGAPARG
jgi:signal transduction histidine kinase